MKTIARLSLVVLPLLVACKDAVPEAKLNNDDMVELVGANRGHEIVVKKGKLTARLRLVGLYAFDPKVRRKRQLAKLADDAVTHWEKNYTGKQLRLALERAEPDPRGRFLGYLYDGKKDIGEQLLRRGIVAVYSEYPWRRADAHLAAEAVARKNASGLWTVKLAVDRLKALRKTWSSIHEREFGNAPKDSWLAEGDAP